MPEPATRAGAYVGPQAECDACLDAAWHAEAEKAPDLTVGELDERAWDARDAGLHPCSNHR